MSRYTPRDVKRVTPEWLHLRELREIRRPNIYASSSRRREERIRKLMTSVVARREFLAEAVAIAAFRGQPMGEGLNPALAELVFGFGVEKLANKLAVNSKSLYRTFSFTERRKLHIDTVDGVLRFFGLKLAVVAIPPSELGQAQRFRLKKVVQRAEKRRAGKH